MTYAEGARFVRSFRGSVDTARRMAAADRKTLRGLYASFAVCVALVLGLAIAGAWLEALCLLGVEYCSWRLIELYRKSIVTNEAYADSMSGQVDALERMLARGEG